MKTEGGFLISQIKHIGGRAFDKLLIKQNISEFNGAQGKILYVLWQKDDISVSELSWQVSLANTTLTGMLDRMEAAGLIRRVHDGKDRRKLRIVLTDRARALQQKYEEVSQQANDIYYEGFTEEEIVQFEGYLRRVLNNVKREVE